MNWASFTKIGSHKIIFLFYFNYYAHFICPILGMISDWALPCPLVGTLILVGIHRAQFGHTFPLTTSTSGSKEFEKKKGQSRGPP